MADKAQTLPATMTCPETGRALRRDTRSFTVRYKGHEVVVAITSPLFLRSFMQALIVI